MLHKNVNKYFGTKKATNARKVEVFGSHDSRDDHEGFRKSRIIRINHHHRHHHSPGQATRRVHAHSRSKNIPSVSPI
jgi:hypothetical protein